MNRTFSIVVLVVLAGWLCACSTQKNTWATRSFHEMKTEYNIYFNGNVSFEEGLKATRDANKDNYSQVLNLYPVSDHQAAQAATSAMDRTIEKCRKCIKLHSIKARPKIDYNRRASDPVYKQWLEQEEFNSKMGDAWMLLAMAEFHKGDFLGAVSTFNYISRHYATDKDMVARCQLWVARAYGEMGWLYEAEDVLGKVQVDDLSRKHSSLYAATAADLKLKTKAYREAIPFIKIAKGDEKAKGNRPRYEFVLGQLYQMLGDPQSALSAYDRVIGLHPSTEMDFNARLQRAQLNPDSKKAIRELERMAKLDKNKDALDQIYGRIGDIYLHRQDTAHALQSYELAIESGTRNGVEKAAVQITAGDIYFARHQYVQAAPCYKGAVQVITPEHADFNRVQRRSEVLDELVVEYSTVQLQDSLQQLAQLSEQEQRVVVDTLIARLIRAEELAKEKAEQTEREAKNNASPRSVNTSRMLGSGAGSGAWYFYNPQLIKNGKQSFATQYGNRALEDNWRRVSKTPTSSFESESEGTKSEEGMPTDSLALAQEEEAAGPKETDDHKPEFYLQQIPRTRKDFDQSNALIADALYKLIYIYREKLEDIPQSDATLKDFMRRFPNEERLLDLYYMQYLYALREDRPLDADGFRGLITTRFPESEQAKIVSQPHYFYQLRQMAHVQDSIYATTYTAYCKGDFTQVKTQKQYMETTYPLTPLMPRFLFLDAIAQARTVGQEAFVASLQDMVQRYPNHELSAMAKDMLALMGQGLESQQGGQMSSLQDRRADQTQGEEEANDTTLQWNPERQAPSQVWIILPADEKNLNHLLYEVALFNFSQFMIKDFDLKRMPMFGKKQSALCLSGLESIDEAQWYEGMLLKNLTVGNLLTQYQAQVVCITTENAAMLGKQKSLTDYLEWFAASGD